MALRATQSEPSFANADSLEKGTSSPSFQTSNNRNSISTARKDEGYPELSEWMGSSNDFFIVRRFSSLMATVVLKMQDDLTILEDELKCLKYDQTIRPEGVGDNGTFRGEHSGLSQVLLQRVLPKLKEYYEMINAYNAIRSRGAATGFQIENVSNWFYNHPEAISAPERAFIKRKSDLFPVYSRPRSPLWLFFERFAGYTPMRGPPRADGGPPQPGETPFETDDDSDFSTTTQLYDSKKLDKWTSFCVVATGYVLLFVPIWLEEIFEQSTTRIGIIMISTALFVAFTLNATTSATRGLEVVAAMAAYTAVLMVYLQSSA